MAAGNQFNFSYEGVTVTIPPQAKPVKAVRLALGPLANMPGKPGGFQPGRLVINLGLVEAAQPDVLVTEFDPPVELRVRFTKADQDRANRAKKPLELAFWNGSEWVLFTKEKHQFYLDPDPNPNQGGEGVAQIRNWIKIHPRRCLWQPRYRYRSHSMAIKSFERYRRGELRSIYEKPKSYTGRRDLDYSPFEPDLQAFPAGRADEISGMLKGITLPELQVLFEAGRLAVEELTLYLLDRIRRCDRDRLNSVSELNPEALEIARSLDAERQIGRTRGPLHGAPVLLKDNIGTGDRLHVSAGAKALEANRSDRDAFLVARLREAGALILGKNNLSEWANFMGKKMPSGFSVVGGQTRSPYGPFMVWGSSSGSAVSVAAGFAFGSVGSETCGSIVAPASQNSVCGLKPSLGLVSRDRMIPLAGAMDTAGPFARTMTDLAVLLNALRGIDSNDRQTESAAELADTDFTQFLDPDGLRGMRIGLLRPGREATAGDWEVLDRAADFLQSGGAEVVAMKEPARLPKGVKLMPVLCYSFREELGRYLEAVGAPVRSLAEVIEFNQADLANRAPWGMENLLSAQGCDLSRDDFDALVQRNRERTAEAIRRKLAAGRLDLLLTLANSYSGFYATAGFPALCVPGGYRASGEPVGVTFVGDYLDEPTLIRAGYAFERISRLRRDPVL